MKPCMKTVFTSHARIPRWTIDLEKHVRVVIGEMELIASLVVSLDPINHPFMVCSNWHFHLHENIQK